MFFMVGKLCIYMLQIFPPTKKLSQKWEFTKKLFECDLCLGVWVFWFLSYLFNMDYLADYFYVPILSELITGAITSFIMHLISVGWDTKFREIRIG